MSCGGLVTGDRDAANGIPPGENAPGASTPPGEKPAIPPNTLSALSLSAPLSPSFAPTVRAYEAARSIPSLFPLPVLTITATPTTAGARVAVGGVVLLPGVATEIPVSTGKSSLDVSVSTQDGVPDGHYTIRLAVAVEQKITYVKPVNAEYNQHFGAPIALDGDTLVVGQHWDQSGGTGVGADPFAPQVIRSGAVFVYTRQNGAWTQQAYIKPPNTHAEQVFGSAVQLKGNLLVVGASGDTNGNGAVFIYQRSGSTWSLKEELRYATPMPWMSFGSAIALGDDVLAVGTRDVYPPSDLGKGGVDIFVPGPTGWVHQAHLNVSGSMAFSGSELAVGASDHEVNGAVFLYARSGTTWSETTRLTGTPPRGSFGSRVAFQGDRLLVGAPRAQSGIGASPYGTANNGGGAVIVFRRSGGTWAEEAMLEAKNARAEANFGWAIALAGEVVAVGAMNETSLSSGFDGNPDDASTSGVGATYLFTRSGTKWMQRAYVKASNSHAWTRFGSSVALAPSMLVVGATGESTRTREIDGPLGPPVAGACGAAYVY